MVRHQEVAQGRAGIGQAPKVSRLAFIVAKRLLMGAATIYFLLFSLASCRDDANILTASTPASVLAFEMRDAAGITIWRFGSRAPHEISVIRYGEVPPGFSQEIPLEGSPRPLRSGKLIRTTTEEPDRTFRHECEATNEKSLRCGGWESAPRRTVAPS